MGEMANDNGSGAGIDLSQFYQVFFEEAGENLERMEQQLLEIDLTSANDEDLNSIFRCAHSVKGGAATFGFNDVAELTHQMETLLDKLRRHELQPTNPMVDVLLQAGDALKAMLGRHQGSGDEPVDTSELLLNIRALSDGQPAPSAAPTTASVRAPEISEMVAAAAAESAATPSPVPVPATAPVAADVRVLELRVGPLPDPAVADNLTELFKEIVDLGQMEPIDGGQSSDGMRRYKVTTRSSDSDLLDLFTFHVSREQVQLLPFGPGYGFHRGSPGAPADAAEGDPGFGFFDDAPGAPGTSAAPQAKAGPSAAAPNLTPDSSQGASAQAATTLATRTAPTFELSPPADANVAAAGASAAATRPGAARADKAVLPEASTLRVSVEKVDQLINLVGELVITQAMLAQNSKDLDPSRFQQLMSGLADLDRNTRDLQESVMSIRMIPMSVVFSRFPRMLRDLANKLGKKVDFVTVGEATELDKGLVEKITDPLTHLVRNSCDHGIESPAERLAKGKPENGTITLSASHQGGSIVIEVKDDGKGLSREKLLRKAREKGIDAPDSMSDSEVWNLIFAPGFSTAEVVTDVSGRGVGMDVVKKNISSLGGTVEIDSAEGYGMRVSVRLPLTLAIMDGMSVGVGDEVYILPLSSVVESFQVHGDMIRTIGNNGRVVEVRDEYMPVLALETTFQVPRFDDESASNIMVVAEAEGGRVALLVDQLLGQQQVVVKNLEANYRKVDDVSGATIMGDGRVALILDVSSLVRRARH